MVRGHGSAYAAIGLLIIVLLYGLFQARTLIRGPVLTVTYPTPGATVAGELYTIRGNAQNISRVSINGRPIMTNLEGDFDEVMVTPEGLGVLLIEAENRLGRYASTRIEFMGMPRVDE